ncbi:MAG: hypothetical protein EA357_01915 [Micavibrio sp.]|nr:MAG: hypothetical protein EA357_01915 [Micavibrio sp.]
MSNEDDKTFFSEFIDAELTQIKISQFIVHFVFVEGYEVAVESSFEHLNESNELVSHFDVYGQTKDVTVHQLLGAKVVNVHSDEDILHIGFSYGGSIKIFPKKQPYESYAVYLKEKHYVV